MKVEKLKEFIDFMEQNKLVELEIEEDGLRIRLKKSSGEPVVISQTPAPQQAAAAAAPAKETAKETTIEIKSPMVGTFYRAPSPEAKPFVEAGDIIKPGDVVCIIEAMKLMNEIKAETGGKIIKILVENGQPVEFGQALFIIEPA